MGEDLDANEISTFKRATWVELVFSLPAAIPQAPDAPPR